MSIDELTSQDSVKLSDSGITKAELFRAIESLKAFGKSINPESVAEKLGVPRALIYSDFEVLQTILHSDPDLYGQDALMKKLIEKITEKNAQIDELRQMYTEAKSGKDKIFSDGFAQGAAVNFKHSIENIVPNSKPIDAVTKLKMEKLALEAWARGILHINSDEALSLDLIKKAYRKLAAVLHPDHNERDTKYLFLDINKAAKVLYQLID